MSHIRGKFLQKSSHVPMAFILSDFTPHIPHWGNMKKFLALTLVVSTSLASHAATITVDDPNDSDPSNTADGLCSLREAIAAAETNTAIDTCAAGESSVADSIFFHADFLDSAFSDGTIVLDNSSLDITSNLLIKGDIDGDLKADITLDANSATRVMRVEANVTINSLNITNGDTSLHGGGIAFEGGDSFINHSTVSGNEAYQGGGISVTGGSLFVNGSLITGNADDDWCSGVAVDDYFFSGTGSVLTMLNTTISGNADTGLCGGRKSELNIHNTTIVDNIRGIALTGDKKFFTMTNTIIADNPYQLCIEINGTDDITSVNSLVSYPSGASCERHLFNEDPILGDLADNGGATLTHLPSEASPVIDAGSDTDCGAGELVNVDQRGEDRDDGSCDIGAVELTASEKSEETEVVVSGSSNMFILILFSVLAFSRRRV